MPGRWISPPNRPFRDGDHSRLAGLRASLRGDIGNGCHCPTEECVMNLKQMNWQTRPALRHVGFAIAIVVATTTLSTASFAGPTPAQKAACTGDVIRLCLTSVGSDASIIACMTKNKDQLSARCKATLPPI
jgi:hypothetical protein